MGAPHHIAPTAPHRTAPHVSAQQVDVKRCSGIITCASRPAPRYLIRCFPSLVCRSDQVFGFEVPAKLPGVPAKVLSPREAWSDKKGYDATRTKLAGMFKDNFTKFVKVRSRTKSIFRLLHCCRNKGAMFAISLRMQPEYIYGTYMYSALY